MQSPRWLCTLLCMHTARNVVYVNIYVCTYIYIVYEYIHISMHVRGIWRYCKRRSCSLRVDYVLFCPYLWQMRHVYVGTTNLEIQGGEDLYDSLSCKSFSAEEPLIVGLFCGKWPITIRHPVGLRHPVLPCIWEYMYGVATISRLLTIIGLFYRI